MKRYNIYNNGMLLTKNPLSENQLDNIKKNNKVLAKNSITNEKKEIPLSSCRIVKCIVI